METREGSVLSETAPACRAESNSSPSVGYLVYCLLATRSGEVSPLPAGIDGQPVVLIEEDGLSAAVTRWEALPASTPPEVAQVLAYEQVVEGLFREQTVLPMRYGCFLESETQVVESLRQHRGEYASALEELEGLVEMGIRLVVDEPSGPAGGEGAAFTGSSSCSGKDFLRKRQSHYAAAERLSRSQEALVERCRTAFAGLFTQCRADPPVLRGSRALLSLYFLVARGKEEVFRRAFTALHQRETAGMLLSGPWPPYNFVP